MKVTKDARKELEILLVRKNSEDFTNKVFTLVEDGITEKFDISNFGQANPQETEYFFHVENDYQDFLITLTKRTYSDKVVVIVGLHTNKNLSEKELYEKKIELKNILVPLFDHCYWVYDVQNERQTQELYALINKAENAFRTLIIHFMTLRHGLDWWEKVPEEVKKGKEVRLGGYEKSLTDLKDISLDLYSLDIKDLTKMVENEYTISVDFKINTIHELPTDPKKLEKNLRKHIEKVLNQQLAYQVKNEKGFWKQELAQYFTDAEEFKRRWDRLTDDRNHIAHNKIVDYNMYSIINKNTRYVIEKIEEAIRRIEDSEVPLEEIYFQDYLDEIIIADTKNRDIEATGYSILSDSTVEGKFIEYLNGEILSTVDDMLYFCEALKTYEVNEPVSLDEEQVLIDVTGFDDEKFTFSIIGADIVGEDGAESNLILKLETDELEERYCIMYRNPSTEQNEDGVFEVVSVDEFDTSELDQREGNVIIQQLESFINDQPTNDEIEELNSDS
ncbi:hypothetical protein A6P54_02695 [Bacillus sp. MKU004]|nr:hypothetical protein A6P54_02695 [Bacillus sp. MKU004]